MVFGPIEHKTNIRYKNMDDFGGYINAMDADYDRGDVIFTGYVFKLKIPPFKFVKRSAYAIGSTYMQEIVPYGGQNCYIPTSGHCFSKSISYLTGKDYTEDFSTFIRTEQRRSNVMTSAIFQPFCGKHNINIICFNGIRTNPRNITQKNIAIKIRDNHFCSLLESNGFSFIQIIKDEFEPKVLIMISLIHMWKVLLNTNLNQKSSISILV